jgi:hypothetical protein
MVSSARFQTIVAKIRPDYASELKAATPLAMPFRGAIRNEKHETVHNPTRRLHGTRPTFARTTRHNLG